MGHHLEPQPPLVWPLWPLWPRRTQGLPRRAALKMAAVASNAQSPPRAPWKREGATAGPRSLLAAQGCRAGGRHGEEGVGVGGGPGKSQREGPGEEQKVPLWRRAERRGSITQCPEAMLVTREPFSASLGKQLGAERDRERFNPMGAGTEA